MCICVCAYAYICMYTHVTNMYIVGIRLSRETMENAPWVSQSVVFCAYLYIYIYIYIYIFVCVCVHVCVCMHLCVGRCVCVHVSVCKVSMNLKCTTHVCVCTQTFASTFAPMHTHTHTHTRLPADMLTHTHLHAYQLTSHWCHTRLSTVSSSALHHCKVCWPSVLWAYCKGTPP